MQDVFIKVHSLFLTLNVVNLLCCFPTNLGWECAGVFHLENRFPSNRSEH